VKNKKEIFRIMPKFLFTTLPSNDLGLLTRSLPIARALSERGHEIAFCSPAKAPGVLIAEAGFQNLMPKHPVYHINFDDLSFNGFIRLLKSKPLKAEYGNFFNFLFQLLRSVPLRFAPQTADVWNMDHAAAMAGMMNTNFVKSHCNAMLKLVVEFNPDVIVDFWNPFACITARILNKPLITVIQADGHPANKGFIWWKEPHEKIPSALPAINRVLTGYGLQPVTKTEELNLGDLTLIVGAPETDPLPKGGQGSFIGPLLWQKSNAELPSWFNEIDDGKPLIWVYSGNPRYAPKKTVFDSEIIIRACIEGLGDEDVQVVLTTGHHSLPKKYQPLPGNFHFATYVPGLTLAEKCDVLIHHGGYGSCQTGLYSGTPAVIIPTFSERESNARRIASLGAGEFIVPTTDKSGRKEITLDEFRAKVRQVLSSPTYTENAKRYGEILKSYGGVEPAVSLIEDFARDSVTRN
jgi:UDP:flavonoid glycosyltransferase YjiC (YdhE family)